MERMTSCRIGLLRQKICSCDTLWTLGSALEGPACSVGGRKEPEGPNLGHVSDAAAYVMMRWFRVQFSGYLSFTSIYESLKIVGFSGIFPLYT